MIDLILREDIPTLGKAGDLVHVRPGYARNFLLPQGLAYEATEGNKKRIAAEKRARDAKLAADRIEAETLGQKLAALSLTFSAKAGEDGKLFGSITAGDIAEKLEAAGFPTDKRRIELEHPLKQLGFHSVPVRLHPDVHADLKVSIEAEA
jgi:large subunit ribosomal protein L9